MLFAKSFGPVEKYLVKIGLYRTYTYRTYRTCGKRSAEMLIL